MKKYLLLVVPVLLLSSCVRHRDMAYLQDAQTLIAYENYRVEVYRIKSFDNLIIKMNSFDGELTDLINQDQTSINITDPKGSLYFNSYTVDDFGFVTLPLLGDVQVKEKTTREISDIIELLLADYVKFPTVSVKLSNFQVTVLGEVKDPGVKYYYDSKLTVFQAIGMAKDLTVYGNRKSIKLIREGESGTSVVILDLTRADLMESDYYFLKPNDLIYVEPTKARTFNLNKSNIELITGLLTFGLLVYNFATP